MEDKKFKYIFSLRLAGFLMMNGFRILRINHNLQKRDKDVYVFENSNELCKMMEKYNEIKNSKENSYVINEGSRSKNHIEYF